MITPQTTNFSLDNVFSLSLIYEFKRDSAFGAHCDSRKDVDKEASFVIILRLNIVSFWPIMAFYPQRRKIMAPTVATRATTVRLPLPLYEQAKRFVDCEKRN